MNTTSSEQIVCTLVARAALGFLVAGCVAASCKPPLDEPFNLPPAQASTDSRPRKKFSIGMVTFAGYAPFYLAKEKGLFGDLDVRLERIEEVSSIRAGMAKGELDAYLATPDIALDTNAPPPGKAVWAIDESAGGDGVVVAGDIKSLAELRGKKVAAEPGLPPNFILLYLLHKNGLELANVQFQDMSTQNAATAFVSKAVDAAGVYEPYLSMAKKQRSGSRIVVSSADVPGLIVDLVFVRNQVIEERPADVQRVIEGWRRALELIRRSPDEAHASMAAAFGLPVGEFKDVVSGIRWLDVEENRRLFGTRESPGSLFQNFGTVVDVLQHNRPQVHASKAKDYLVRDFLQ